MWCAFACLQSHEEEVKSYLEQLNAGMFADPDSSAPIVLAELNNVRSHLSLPPSHHGMYPVHNGGVHCATSIT